MTIKTQLLTFVSLFLLVKAFSGPLPMKHFTTENGLPSNTAFSLFFDSKGYLWIPSDKGLVRYNGSEFKKFTINDGLPDNEVFGLSEDYQGRLWIATLKGVLCYYQDNVFHTAANTSWLKLKDIKIPCFFNQLMVQKDSSMVTTSFDGSFVLDIKNERLKIISIKKLWSKGIFNDPATLSRKLEGSQYQIFYNHRSFIIDTMCRVLKMDVYKDSSLFVSCLSPQRQYLASEKGIYNLDMQLILSRKLKIINRNAYFVAAIKDKDHFFLGAYNGLLYNKDGVLLKDTHITGIGYDKLGNIWISTLENGIYCLSSDFESIYTMPITHKIIASASIDSSFCFATENGQLYHTGNLNRVVTFIPPTRDHNGKLFTKPTFLLLKDGSMLWGNNESFYYKPGRSSKFRTIYFKSSINLGYPVKNIYHFNGNIYIAYRSSLLVVPIQAFEKDTLDANQFLVYKAENLARIYCTAINKSDSSFWFSRLNGMYSFKKGKIVQHPEFNDHTFRQFSFYKNYLVGSTDDNKFFIYNTQTKILDSVPNSNCVWETIYPIDDYTAIINTDDYYKVLTLFPPDQNGKPKYRLENLGNFSLPTQADYIFGSKRMYYFQRNGTLTGIPASILLKETVAPLPLFVSLKAGKTNYPIRPIISISYGEARTIGIPIDVIDYSNMDHITEYSISKNGEEDKWNAITGNEINFNEAGYGKYIIKLRSKIVSGTFSEPITLTLIIQKPYWATWWFSLSGSIVFLLVSYITIHLIARRQILKKQRIHDAEMKFQQSEYKALNALMNPHFIFNSLNNIQGLINKNSGETASQYLVIFSKLIRQNMMNISKGFVSLQKELELVENYLNLEKLRFRDFINYSIEVDDEIDTEQIMISPLLIQPLVENAIIHGLLPKQSSDNMLNIKIREEGDLLFIEITDNGIGISNSLNNKNPARESYGLSNLRRRIDHLKKIQNREIDFELKEIIDTDKNVSGTIALITIKQTPKS